MASSSQTRTGSERAAGATAREPVEGVKSVMQAIDVVELIARQEGGAGFPEIRSELGIAKSSLHNVLRTLELRGWIALDPEERVYRIGVRCWEAGQAFARGGFDLATECLPFLQTARRDLDETIQLSVLDGRENVYIAKVEAEHPLRLVSEVGSRLPAHATGLGKALFSGLADEQVLALLEGVDLEPFTEHTIVDRDELLRQLAEIRARGYAEDHGEYTPGVFCIAVPVRAHDGAVVAAISSSVPEVRVSPPVRERMIEVLSDQAERFSAVLQSRGVEASQLRT